MSRFNIEENSDGTIRICRGDHHRSEDCEWEEFVPRERLDELARELALAEERILRLERSQELGPSTDEAVIRAAFALGVKSTEKPPRAPRAPRQSVPQVGGDTGGEW